jgi:predicted TIM-barrel enzyme
MILSQYSKRDIGHATVECFPHDGSKLFTTRGISCILDLNTGDMTRIPEAGDKTIIVEDSINNTFVTFELHGKHAFYATQDDWQAQENEIEIIIYSISVIPPKNESILL